MNARPEENYGLPGLPTEVEYLRADRAWLSAKIAQMEAIIAANDISQYRQQIASLESQMRGQTFLTPDEKDARIEKLEAALRKFETFAMIVEPRSHKAEWLAMLSEVRSLLNERFTAETKPYTYEDHVRETMGSETETNCVHYDINGVCQHCGRKA